MDRLNYGLSHGAGSRRKMRDEKVGGVVVVWLRCAVMSSLPRGASSGGIADDQGPAAHLWKGVHPPKLQHRRRAELQAAPRDIHCCSTRINSVNCS